MIEARYCLSKKVMTKKSALASHGWLELGPLSALLGPGGSVEGCVLGRLHSLLTLPLCSHDNNRMGS